MVKMATSCNYIEIYFRTNIRKVIVNTSELCYNDRKLPWKTRRWEKIHKNAGLEDVYAMKNMKWFLLIGICGLFFTVMAGMPKHVEAADSVLYDAGEFESFKNRSKEEIGRKYGEALYAGETYEDGNNSSYYETPCSLEAPYAAGQLTEDTHKTMTAMTNFYRYLVGTNELTATSVHSDKLQAEALVRNFEFAHMVSSDSSKKPEDMEQELWDYGALDYQHNILALGSTPRGAITSWMNEGYSLYSGSWDTLGHRYDLISSSLSEVCFSYSGYVAAGSDNENNNMAKEAFTAFPAPGYMPANLVSAKTSAWSLQLNLSKITITDANAIVVKVSDVTTGKSYECKKSEDTLIVKPSLGGAIIGFKQPEPKEGNHYDGTYCVKVTGVVDVETGKEAVLTYTTEFFDPTEYTPSYVNKVTLDGITEFVVYQSMAAMENLEKISYALPEEVTIITENNRRMSVPVKGKWVLDEVNHCWTNQADVSSLPEDISDRNHKLDCFSISYIVSKDMYDYYNTLRIDPSLATEGGSGKMIVHRTLVSTDTSAIFQLIKNPDGTYHGFKKYDSRSSLEFDAEESAKSDAYHIYQIPSFKKSDEGEYFSIYYNSTDETAYVSTSIQTLFIVSGAENGGSEDSGENKQNEQNEQNEQIPVSSQPNVSRAEQKATNAEVLSNSSANLIQENTQGEKKTIKVPERVVVKKKKKGKNIKLTFLKPNAIGYEVVYANNKAFKKAAKKSLKKKTFVLKKKKGKKYFIKVRAYILTPEGRKVYGKYSATIKG